ncbi:hypothetical protein PtA15_7A22 [Puccinia triticina]|uniref:C2H2-type domain-containing protein n=1 Tax=Puccinia triticina TaxID=208348 RepID=A0ABY7CM43_9BASI|nr:uncharacterized protein PtA15_7A22 [Puccinia triticina]WAQ86296.1 hypothetical protein PtA15_7A22 [Puccinia triticina]WAR56174.1 hypothetical protein PtB15_7B19 [Puccinia triticina]
MSIHLLTSPGPALARQPAAYTTARAAHSELAASLWGHFHPPAFAPADSLAAIDFPSNVPTLWGYQTLLGFTPAALSQLNPYCSQAYPQALSSSPSQATTPYAERDQPFDQQFSSFPPSLSAGAATPTQPIPYYHLPSPSRLIQNPAHTAFEQNSRHSPAFKMFKCTLDPSCEMEFTRAEHLARHERKHTKEKPFKCHCAKSFSRLDNWRLALFLYLLSVLAAFASLIPTIFNRNRQHKVSVHKEDAQQNALTEERLVQVHKSMQRQNNIRKAATMAAQRQDRPESCPSMTGSSSESAYSPAPSSFSDTSLRHPSATGYVRRQSQPSPLPAKTPDKALWSQLTTPPFNNHPGHSPSPSTPMGIVGNSNSSLLIPSDSHPAVGTPSNTVQYDAATYNSDKSDEFHRLAAQYPPRLINYNQVSRAPLSSLWPTLQQFSSSSATYPASPYEANAATYEAAAPGTQSADQAAGLVFKMNDSIFSHHLRVLSSMTHEQTAILTPRKPAGGLLGHADLGYLENQRAYSSYLLVGQNTPDFAAAPSRKRALVAEDAAEAGASGHPNEPNSVKKIRI